MKDDVYPDVKGNVGPDLSEVTFQKVIEVNGRQKIVTTTRQLTKRQKKAQFLAEQISAYTKIPTTVSNILPDPVVKKKPVTESPNWTCHAAGFEIECLGNKKKAHIITRQAVALHGKSKNILGLCEAHERWFNMQPLKVWYRFVKRNHPEHFDFVLAKTKFVLDQVNEYLEVAEEEQNGFGIVPIVRAKDKCSCDCHVRYPEWWCLNCANAHVPQKQKTSLA